MSDNRINNQDNIDISVVIPVYNCEKYLEKCLNSILAQNNVCFEVIVMDDSSTDSSADICRQYADNDDRIVFSIEEKNMGVSHLRNKGISMARGSYIMFVDSDDYIPADNVLSVLYEKALDSGRDIITGNYSRQKGEDIVDANRHDFTDDVDTSTRAYRYRAFFSNGIMAYVWCKLYRTDFLRDNNLKFAKIFYAEDQLFNVQCYLRKATYSFVTQNTYCYRKRNYSKSTEYHNEFEIEWMYIAGKIYKELVENGTAEQYEDIVALTVFFAVFFHAKKEYIYSKRKLKIIRNTLKKYMMFELAKREFKLLARGRLLKKNNALFWNVGIRFFSILMILRWYGLLSIGIKLIADIGIDTALSSTGRSLS